MKSVGLVALSQQHKPANFTMIPVVAMPSAVRAATIAVGVTIFATVGALTIVKAEGNQRGETQQLKKLPYPSQIFLMLYYTLIWINLANQRMKL